MKEKELQDLIKKNTHLLWYIEDPQKVSHSALVEAFLSYGEWEEIQKMIKIIGKKNVAQLFREQINKKRVNYSKKTQNFFSLYLNDHV